MNTDKLIRTAQSLAIHLGGTLSEAEALCNAGTPWDSKALTRLAAQMNELQGAINAIYYCAKMLLSPAEFDAFAAGTTISRALIADGIKRIEELVNQPTGYGRN